MKPLPLHALVILVFAAMTLAQAETMPGWAQTPNPTGELSVNAGELRLDGKIGKLNLDQKSFVLNADSFTVPSGRTRPFDTPKPKTIVLNEATLLYVRGAATRKVTLTDLKAGDFAIVIGLDSGSGQPLTARALAVWDKAEGGVYSFRENSPETSVVAPPVLNPNSPPNTTVEPEPDAPDFPEGTFEDVDKKGNPVGWVLGDRQHARVVEEEGNHFLRLTNNDPTATFYLENRVGLNPAWKSVKVRVRMRAKNLKVGKQTWESARLGFIFEKGIGERIGDYPDTPKLTTDSDWVNREVVVPVPPGATLINLQPIMMLTTGTFDLDDIQVIGNPPLTTKTIRPGFPEGSFETLDDNGQPLGWELNSPQIKVVEEDGNHFLRLTNQNPQVSVFVDNYFKLDPTWKAITLRVRERAKNLKAGTQPWENARLGYTFMNATGQRVGDWPVTPDLRQDTKSWRIFTMRAEIPTGAVYIKLTPILHNTTGTLDIDDIKIEQAGT
ncbi:MAG: hypothetical protein JO316_06055 [Abitibacteriaceae bacterium]|nr:hypothetical protein [Abditibacteriaceae bacterium]